MYFYTIELLICEVHTLENLGEPGQSFPRSNLDHKKKYSNLCVSYICV